MIKWKYKIKQSDCIALIESDINKLGDQGWELVSIIESNGLFGTFSLIFKRPNND